MKVWGKLTRSGGTEEGKTIPSVVQLTGTASYIGRFAQPAKTFDNRFSHNFQSVIPCLFISSTHCSFEVDPAKQTCFVRDHSRNGTFVNGTAVGAGTKKEICDGDELSFKYKNVVRLSYTINIDLSSLENENMEPTAPAQALATRSLEQSPSVPVPDKVLSPMAPAAAVAVPVGAIPIPPGSGKDMADMGSHKRPLDSQALDPGLEQRKRHADYSSEIMARQLHVLQEEEKKQQHRMNSYALQIDSLTQKLGDAEQLIATHVKTIGTQEKQISDLKEHCTACDSNLSATEAKVCNLEEELEKVKRDLKEMKSKHQSAAGELFHRTEQLDTWKQLVEDANRAFAVEKENREQTEEACTALREKVRALTNQYQRVKTSNEVLQTLNSDLEGAHNMIKTQNSALHVKLLRTREAQSQAGMSVAALQSKSSELLRMCSQLAASAVEAVKLTGSTGALLTDSDFDEHLCLPVSDGFGSSAVAQQQAASPVATNPIDALRGEESGGEMDFEDDEQARNNTMQFSCTQVVDAEDDNRNGDDDDDDDDRDIVNNGLLQGGEVMNRGEMAVRGGEEENQPRKLAATEDNDETCAPVGIAMGGVRGSAIVAEGKRMLNTGSETTGGEMGVDLSVCVAEIAPLDASVSADSIPKAVQSGGEAALRSQEAGVAMQSPLVSTSTFMAAAVSGQRSGSEREEEEEADEYSEKAESQTSVMSSVEIEAENIRHAKRKRDHSVASSSPASIASRGGGAAGRVTRSQSSQRSRYSQSSPAGIIHRSPQRPTLGLVQEDTQEGVEERESSAHYDDGEEVCDINASNLSAVSVVAQHAVSTFAHDVDDEGDGNIEEGRDGRGGEKQDDRSSPDLLEDNSSDEE